MDNKKPLPMFPQQSRKNCPVCGKASYSRDGIHPQCAQERADTAKNKLAKVKKQKSKNKPKPRKGSLNKKCPSCHIEVHVRLKTCVCGHAFGPK